MGSWDRHFYAITAEGNLKWRFETQDKISSSPAIGQDDTIYFGSDDHHLYAVDPNGKLKWRFKTGGAISSSPAIGTDGVIYVGSHDNGLYAVNASSNGYQRQSPWPGFHFNHGRGN